MGYLGYTRSNKLVLMCIAALSALVTWRNETADGCKVYVTVIAPVRFWVFSFISSLHANSDLEFTCI